MTKTKKQSPIKVRIDTAQQIRFLSEKSGLSMTQLLSEVIGAIFNIGCVFKSINFEYEYDISNAQITITIKGKSNLEIGSFDVPITTSNKVIDKKIAKRLCDGKRVKK